MLFDAREMQQMILTKMAGKTVVLRMGSEGPLVKKLQMRLAQRLGMQMKLDGKFGAQHFVRSSSSSSAILEGTQTTESSVLKRRRNWE